MLKYPNTTSVNYKQVYTCDFTHMEDSFPLLIFPYWISKYLESGNIKKLLDSHTIFQIL